MAEVIKQLMNQINFKIDKGDHNVGTVYLPDSVKRNSPVVIYCHGWGSNRSLYPSTQRLCTALRESSASMVTFDFYGCGETGGNYNRMSYGRWMSNLADVSEWVTGQDWADRQKIGCFSVSSGTTAALRFAEISREVAFVVSVATCLGLFINMPNSPARILVDRLQSLTDGGTAEVFGTHFDLDFFKDFIGNAPVYNLQDISCPVFFLQGAADNPWRRSDAWVGYLVMQKNGQTVKYLEIEGGDHGLDNVPERCTQEVVTWLKEMRFI
jgi:pimeloyl-ACP methyl ester carboxylesterase